MNDLRAMPPARQVVLPGGGSLNVHEQAGTGPTLLLLHGFTDCAESFWPLLPHLAGHHVVIPDLRGHGLSFRGPIPSLATFAQDIEAMAGVLGLARVILVGHSMGALVAVALAARGILRIDGLVTISGSLKPSGPPLRALSDEFRALPSPLPLTHPFLDEWYRCTRPVAPDLLGRLRASCVAMRPEDWLACLDLLENADLTRQAATLDCRAVVLSGSEDRIFPPSHHANTLGTLRFGHGVVFAGAGHNPHWEQPDQIATEVLTLVSQVTAAT